MENRNVKIMECKYIFILFLCLFCIACQQETGNKNGSEKRIEEIKTSGSIADIIRNPVSANKPLDTINIAKMTFAETVYDFGKIKEGKTVEHTFKFINDGKTTLLINDVRSTCGCTIPSWPREPIEPGDSGKIKVVFKSEGKKDQQRKPVTITANTFPSETVLYMNGTVLSK